MWLNKSITQKSNLIENIIEKSAYEKLLGVNVDYNVKFSEHLESILKKAMRKVNALSRILPYRNFEKRRILNELVFYVTVQLLLFSTDISQLYNH